MFFYLPTFHLQQLPAPCPSPSSFYWSQVNHAPANINWYQHLTETSIELVLSNSLKLVSGLCALVVKPWNAMLTHLQQSFPASAAILPSCFMVLKRLKGCIWEKERITCKSQLFFNPRSGSAEPSAQTRWGLSWRRLEFTCGLHWDGTRLQG